MKTSLFTPLLIIFMVGFGATGLLAQPFSLTHSIEDHYQKLIFTHKKHGRVLIALPREIRPGDTFILGHLSEETASFRQDALEKSGMTLYFPALQQEVSLQRKKFLLSDIPSTITRLEIELRSRRGKILGEATLPLSWDVVMQNPGEVEVPKWINAGSNMLVEGVVTDQDMQVQVQDKILEKLVQSPRMVLFQVPENLPLGKQKLHIQHKIGNAKVFGSTEVRVVQMHLSVGKTKLQAGQETFLKIQLDGLQNYEETASVQIKNHSPSTIQLSEQSIPVSKNKIDINGIFQTTSQIKAIQSGDFSLSISTITSPRQEKVFLYPDPAHQTLPADQLKPLAEKEPLIGAKSKLKIYLREGSDVWLEFEDGWRKAEYREVTHPETGKPFYTWYADMQEPGIPRGKIFERYQKSLVEVVSEMSDSGLGMLFPGLDAWNSFNKGDYGWALLDVGLEFIPLLGKLDGVVRIFRFGNKADDAKDMVKLSDEAIAKADETMDCAAETVKQQKRIERAASSARLFPANGIASHHAKAFSKIAKENKMIIVVRNGNPASLRFHGQAIPKPMNVKAKTMKAGPAKGLVVNPGHPTQRKYWMDHLTMMKRRGEDAFAEANKAYKEALESWNKFEKQHGVFDESGQLVAYKNGFEISKQGLLKVDGKAIHGDYDLHGVYMKSSDSNKQFKVNMGDGTARTNNYDESAAPHWRDIFNQELSDASPRRCDQIQHGSHDDWINLSKLPDPPVTAFLPNGDEIYLESVRDMHRFYQAHNMPWPAGYPVPFGE